MICITQAGALALAFSLDAPEGCDVFALSAGEFKSTTTFRRSHNTPPGFCIHSPLRKKGVFIQKWSYRPSLIRPCASQMRFSGNPYPSISPTTEKPAARKSLQGMR